MYKIVLFILLLLFPIATNAEEIYGNSPPCKIVSIYDGDTLTVDIPDWPDIIGKRISIRVVGIDCPELKDKRPEIKDLARKAKQFAVGKLRSAEKTGHIELHNLRRDKYFRIDANVMLFDDSTKPGISLGDLLIKQGLAKPYDGGTKSPW